MTTGFMRAVLAEWHRTPLYGFDIETTGLRWDQAQVTTFAIYGADVSVVHKDDDEEALLHALLSAFNELDPGTVVTWNGAVFDGPFVAGRLMEHTLYGSFRLAPNFAITPKYEPQPGFAPIGFDPIFCAHIGEHAHLDIAYGYWRRWAEDNDVHWALKPVARAVGLDVIEVDREHMDSLSEQERSAYCLSDAKAAYRLAEIAASEVSGHQLNEEVTVNA